MGNAESILVIILSVTLTIFLLAAITLTILLIQLAKRLKRIAETAQSVAGNVEAAAQILKQSAGPLAVARFMANIADVVTKRKKGGK